MASLKDIIEETLENIGSLDEKGLKRLMEGTAEWFSEMQKKIATEGQTAATNSALEMQQYLNEQMEKLKEKSGIDIEALEKELEGGEIEELKNFENDMKGKI